MDIWVLFSFWLLRVVLPCVLEHICIHFCGCLPRAGNTMLQCLQMSISLDAARTFPREVYVLILPPEVHELPSASRVHPLLILSVIFILANEVSGRWYLTVILICFCLMTSDLSVCLLVIWMSCFVKCYLSPLSIFIFGYAPFSNWPVNFFIYPLWIGVHWWV